MDLSVYINTFSVAAEIRYEVSLARFVLKLNENVFIKKLDFLYWVFMKVSLDIFHFE